MIRVYVIAAFLVLTGGCCSSEYNARVFHPWGWENAKEFKGHLDQYRHVLVVRVSESYWEDKGPGRLTPCHFKGKVVRSYKGDWRVSEGIAFVHYVDSPAPTNAPGRTCDELMFVLTNEHTNAEIVVDTGDFNTYNAIYAPALECVFRNGASHD
jgi:hypothetical protein